MPFLSVWIHLVWSTHKRRPLLTDHIRPNVFAHIRTNAHAKGIVLDHIGGYRDHVHCLISLKADQTLAQIVQLIKGESTHWINQQGLTGPERFAWQSDYWAGSVSQSRLEVIRRYIRRQEQHHRQNTFADEYALIMDAHPQSTQSWAESE